MNSNMGNFVDLAGKRFGKWTVIKKSASIGNGAKPCVYWECMCDCGTIREVMGSRLRSGVSKSCGCYKVVHLVESPPRKTHGGSRADRLYRVWRGMIDRCYYPSHNRYSEYGGRGIFICEEWRSNYAAFREWAITSGYNPFATRGACTIDRIDVDGPYAPWNCRWVDMKVQAHNKQKKAGAF